MATWSRSFASFTEFTDFAAQSQAGSSHENGEDWAGTPDFASALALARQGWESGAKRIGEISARIGDSIAPRTYREELDYSPVGPGTLDLDRYQMGHPESYQVWVDTEDTVESNRGFLHLVVNLSASAGIDAEVMFTKGAAVCALVDCLERDGYRCEIDVYGRGSRGDSSVESRFRLKNANDPLEPEGLAMAIAHPSTFRRLMFAVWEQAPSPVKKGVGIYPLGAGYGSPSNTDGEHGDIHVPEATWGGLQWQSPELAAQWVREELARQGVTIEE